MSNLKREAAYMYIESQKILKLNEKIKDISNNIHHWQEKMTKTNKPEERLKLQKETEKMTKLLHELSKEHSELLLKLRHHHLNFEHLLQREHSTRK